MRYGYFDNENREYVIDRVDLPVSWTSTAILTVPNSLVRVNGRPSSKAA